MHSSPEPPESAQCPICRAEVSPAIRHCGACGSKITATPAEEIRSLNYLLSELERWEAEGFVGREQANALREDYERRREDLRARLAVGGRRPGPAAPSQQINVQPAEHQARHEPPGTNYPGEQLPQPSTHSFPPAVRPPGGARMPPKTERAPRRTLLETLADPHTIRVLLYTGAAMLVVGVVIWLRDILYLKLQEPVVQAGLLAAGTVGATVAGWLTILRTRLRLTGRALTLTGSLLVPVNFWFLVRSGLVENNGRAWLVCAFCALLYAHTAALLREKLYVYLASIAAIGTAWTLVYRVEHEAFGLYALLLSAASIVFLHLSRLFPVENDEKRKPTDDKKQSIGNPQSEFRNPQSALSYQLWGPPLVHVALVGAALAVLFYMPLRFGTTTSFADGILRLRSSEYDPGIGILLFAMGAYAAWFTGRYIYTDRRVLLYAIAALALFWTEFLATDGFDLSSSWRALILAFTAFTASLLARVLRDHAPRVALHRASLIVSVALASIIYAVISNAPAYTLTHGAILFFLAATFAVSSAPRLCEKVMAATLAHLSALFASAAFLVVVLSLDLQSETLFYAACALWPFILYAVARLTRGLRRETQLTIPFLRIADIGCVLLLLRAAAVAFVLNQAVGEGIRTGDNLRGGMFSLLSASILYSLLRVRFERSVFGAALFSVASLILVGATADALKSLGALPAAWPVATAIIMAAFLLREVADRLLSPEREKNVRHGSRLSAITDRLSRIGVIRLVADCAVVASAALWFTTAIYRIEEGGMSAAVVLCLALLYWGERAANLRRQWPVALSGLHLCALCLALLIALQVEVRWFASASIIALFPIFFLTASYARARNVEWLAGPSTVMAALVAAAVAGVSIGQALNHLRVGEPLLLAPAVALGALALLSFGASLLSKGRARVRYFRAGLCSLVLTFALICLRAGYDPLGDIEIYTSPVALLLLLIASLSMRRKWEEYAGDTSLLLWVGSLLLAAPLLMHALEFRVLREVPALWRDLATLCASLALIIFGGLGRLRAPLLVGATSLVLELVALTVTSVEWLQIPLKVYLISVGALILLIWGLLEFRREQILLLRRRLSERRDYARERFGEWK
ncbi:MAG TPA: hypothetical protein VF791_16260 [Pyrinomonadaceae bacterium]